MCLVILHQAGMKKWLMQFVVEQCAINTLRMGKSPWTYFQREIVEVAFFHKLKVQVSSQKLTGVKVIKV